MHLEAAKYNSFLVSQTLKKNQASIELKAKGFSGPATKKMTFFCVFPY